MSYYTGFKVPEEVMKKYDIQNAFNKPWAQMGALFYCMNPKDESFSAKYYALLSLLTAIERDTINDTYEFTYKGWKKEKGEVWFAGREYTEPCIRTQQELREQTLEDLLMLTEAVPTPDWFDDNEKFTEKYKEIKSTIEYFVDETRDITEHGIIDDLNDTGVEKIGDNKNTEENAD